LRHPTKSIVKMNQLAIYRLITLCLLSLSLFSFYSCDILSSSSETEEVELQWPSQLERVEFFLTADDTLSFQESVLIRAILPGEYYATDYEEPLEITFSAGHTESTYQAGLLSWDFLSNESMRKALHYGSGPRYTMIGPKEEDQEVGVTRCEAGQESLFDESLADEIADWVNEKSNISAWRSGLAVYASFDDESYPALEQVESIREHRNVWFLKPVTGVFFKTNHEELQHSAEDNCNEIRREMAAVIDFDELSEALSLEHGSHLTVSYTQPDGEIINDKVVLRKD